MTAVTNYEQRPDQTPWQYGLVRVGVVGDGFNDAGGQTVDVANDLTDDIGFVSFDLAAGQYYVWTGPDRRQVSFGPVPSSGGPYTLQSLANTGTPPGPLAASAEALAALAAQISALNWRGIAYVEDYGTPGGVDDSTLLGIAASTAAAAGKVLRGQYGVTYRGHFTVPTGLVLDLRGAKLKTPDGGAAGNILTGSGPWVLYGGELDGNKANTTDPGVTTSGNGIYQYAASGWAGTVKLLEGPVFHDLWRSAVNLATDTTSLVDAVNAPASAAVLDHVEALDCEGIALRFTGVNGLELISPRSHDNTLHGIRTYLSKRIVARDADCRDNVDHGFASLYCYDSKVDGVFEDNGTDGLVFGGDSSSATLMPGRAIKVPQATCRRNGNQGLIFDASLAGTNALIGLGVNDPIPVDAWVGSVTAEGNTDEGVVVNSSQYVTIVDAKTHGNGGHGVQFATSDATLLSHDARGNGQKPLALEPATNWGGHKIGVMRYSGNTPDDTLVYDPDDFTTNPCTFLTRSTDPDGGALGIVLPALHGAIAWAYEPVAASTNTIPTAGVLQLVEIEIDKACTITELWMYVVTGGSSLVNGFLALYDASKNRLGVTANRATAWQTAGLDTPALVTPVDVLPGKYRVGWWWTGTTGPSVARINTNSTLINANLGAADARFGTADTGLTTTAPNPYGTLAKAGVAYWAAVA